MRRIKTIILLLYNTSEGNFMKLGTNIRIPMNAVSRLPAFCHKIEVKDKYSCILGVIILLCNNPVTLLIRAPDKRGY